MIDSGSIKGKVHSLLEIKDLDIAEVIKIKEHSNTDVYLCGGGVFAAWLLEHELIDVLKLKINPLILGQGVKIFGASTKQYRLNLMESQKYEEGLLINTYSIQY